MEALAWEPSIDSAGIGVSTESGIVMLTGTVKSLPQKNGRPSAWHSALRA